MRKRVLLVSVTIVLALLSSMSAHGLVLHGDRSFSEAAELGRGYPATVRFLPDGCGTLVAPDWVLTAAHVARGLSPFGRSVEIAGQRYGIARVVFHPKAGRIPEQAPEVDVALVQLDAVVEHVVPAPLYGAGDEVGQVATIVGYGDYAPAKATDYTSQDGTRRAATNRIDGVLGSYLYITLDEGEGATRLEGASAPGDSGGSLYLETEGGPVLAGVSSFTIGKPLEYNSRDHFTRVSALRDWIKATLRSDADGSASSTIDVKADGMPEGVRGGAARAFIEAFNRGPEAFAEFAGRHVDPESWSGLGGRHGFYGDLMPLRLRELAADHTALLVKLGKLPGHRVVNLYFDASGSKIRDVGIGVARLDSD